MCSPRHYELLNFKREERIFSDKCPISRYNKENIRNVTLLTLDKKYSQSRLSAIFGFSEPKRKLTKKINKKSTTRGEKATREAWDEKSHHRPARLIISQPQVSVGDRHLEPWDSSIN